MTPKFYKERLAKKNEIELTAALVVLIEKINSEREKCEKMFLSIDPKSINTHYVDGEIHGYNNIMNIIDILL